MDMERSEKVPPLPIRGRPVSRESDRKFIFVTPDGWNYRLIDITEVETAEALRTVICYNLGIPDSPEVTVHMTSPGQLEHNEPLSDNLLVNARIRMADPRASLKLFVRAPAMWPDSAGLGLGFGHGTLNSPFGKASFSGKPLDEATYARLTNEAHERLDSPGLMFNENTPVPDDGRVTQNLQKGGSESIDRMTAPLGTANHSRDNSSLTTKQDSRAVEAKAEEHHVGNERSQKAVHESRQQRPRKEGSSECNADYTFRRDRVVDFDAPRLSPYEERRPLSGDIAKTPEPL
ncbi:hypothetical protein LTR28_001909, partial [Elasticomyces elasticus]